MISQLMENMLDEYANLPIRSVKNVRLENRQDREGKCLDGWGYIILEDGKDALQRESPKREVWFSLISETNRPLSLIVEYKVFIGDEYIYAREIIQPKEFDLQLGDLRVTIHPQYCNCRVSLGDYNIKTRSLRINFFEGEAVWVYLKLLPTGGGKEKEFINANS